MNFHISPNTSQAQRDAPQFCPIPIRAMGDGRLAASHYRVLCAISYHDRLGVNGAGCYAGARTLAREAQIDPTYLARITADLVEWGYLNVSRSPKDGRRHVFSLIYNDKRIMVGKKSNYSAADAQTGENQNKLDHITTIQPEIVVTANRQVIEAKEESQRNIFPKRESNKSYEAPLGQSSIEEQNRSREAQPSREEKEAKQEAHNRIVRSLGGELYAEALERLGPEAWDAADHLEHETPGSARDHILKALAGFNPHQSEAGL